MSSDLTGILKRWGYCQVFTADPDTWLCPFCKTRWDSSALAFEHQQTTHGVVRTYYVPVGVFMWLYEVRPGSHPTAHTKEYVLVPGTSHDLTTCAVTYTEADVVTNADLSTTLMLFYLPPNARRIQCVAFRRLDVEVREHAVPG